ncbi:MAG: hypothetical protein ABI954_15170 [Pyrinomonadaceae bacterium]
MPVVINEFEIVPAEREQNQTDKKPNQTAGQQKPPLSDYEVKKMIQRQRERFERVRAH